MSAVDSTPFGEEHLVEKKTSGLAIGSLICSLIMCCPLTTIIGPILGLAAVFTIGSNPARKGKGLAFAGIIIGIIATAGWGVASVWGYNNFYVPEQEGPVAVMTAGFAGDNQAFRMGLMGEAANGTDEEIQEFIDALRDRYGDFIICEIDKVEFTMNPPTFEELMQPVKTYPYIFQFENATLKARVDLSAQDPQTGNFLWGLKFGTILILDDNLGDIVYPKNEAENAVDTPSESETTDESDSPGESDTPGESDSGEGQ